VPQDPKIIEQLEDIADKLDRAVSLIYNRTNADMEDLSDVRDCITELRTIAEGK
jgi:hypothetical protein